MQKELEAIYLDWVNNYLTTEIFAEHYMLNIDDATKLLEILRRNNEELELAFPLNEIKQSIGK